MHENLQKGKTVFTMDKIRAVLDKIMNKLRSFSRHGEDEGNLINDGSKKNDNAANKPKKYIDGKTSRKAAGDDNEEAVDNEVLPKSKFEIWLNKYDAQIKKAFNIFTGNNSTKIASVLAVVLCCGAILYVGISTAVHGDNSTATTILPSTSQNYFANVTAEITTTEKYSSPNQSETTIKDAISVYDIRSGQVVTDSAALIVAQALETEMGEDYDYEPEAMKAQAVAIYSFLCYHGANSGQTPSITLSPASKKCIDAANAVSGKVMNYNGRPIEALWCEVTPGKTANNSDVWGNSVPYLVSVDSSEDKSSPNYENKHTFKSAQIRKLVKQEYGVDLSKFKDKAKWFTAKYDKATGLYVTTVSIGGKKTVSGLSVKMNLLGENRVGDQNALESQAFKVKYDKKSDSFTFTVHGVGNGVGMSKYGANEMAKKGQDYTKILAKYYKGTVIE